MIIWYPRGYCQYGLLFLVLKSHFSRATPHNNVNPPTMLTFLYSQIYRCREVLLCMFFNKITFHVFQIDVFQNPDSNPPHLHGSTSFGDNIDDEWFIVSLLYEITREFAGTVVR